mmetsp:Transcript_31753/g.38355  ORF Transcript_31753/g.38355 Transcript_31753/m.38355 type:complete len:229 (+) Transcript_31753:326-1012(+)|eukprot:CAMPEP_0197844996 /NCGR_PEP_ID=MMETSP1438-20131217/1958_1 /TAXON_ID=1461541 /ORGANISM="Pterosperma sp., Strain CCMP1384" /LENGTH=228 /DNA_ID=CAMNT_0043456057 /DNA_START=325 /DNA_END=1011 /DNA_ORIENTATION=-
MDDKDLNLCRDLRGYFAECGAEASPQSITALQDQVAQGGSSVKHVIIPSGLQALWHVAAEWHLYSNHFNILGLNIFPPEKVIAMTKNVFGDEDNMETWKLQVSQGQDTSCAHDGWVCIGSISDYDYIFTNVDADSPHHGDTRHMVNNCTNETLLTKSPFSNFLLRLDGLVRSAREMLEMKEPESIWGNIMARTNEEEVEKLQEKLNEKIYYFMTRRNLSIDDLSLDLA